MKFIGNFKVEFWRYGREYAFIYFRLTSILKAQNTCPISFVTRVFASNEMERAVSVLGSLCPAFGYDYSRGRSDCNQRDGVL